MLPVPVRSSQLELLDTPDSISDDLQSNLRDIRRLNSLFGGTALAVQCTRRVLGHRDHASVIDIATGSADILSALQAWGHRTGVTLDLTGCDISREVLFEAAQYTRNTGISLSRADARALPWGDRSFDIALCCLAMHHFEPNEARIVLSEMWRVARVGIVVTDLYRSYPAYWGTTLATLVAARNRVTRHDGPLSVLRAYTPSELRKMVSDCGIEGARVRRHPFFRQTLTALKERNGRG